MAYALPNTFLGIVLTKQQRYAKAVSQAEKNKNQYVSCKNKQINKGKIPFPEDPKGNCKTDWKQWQKWRGKKGERALKLAERMEKQGRLEPSLAQELQAIQIEAQNETPQVLASTFEPSAEFEQMTDEDLAAAVGAESGPNYMLIGGAVVGTALLVGLGYVFLNKK